MARIGVIGGGIAGMGAAWALDHRHEVVLYESEARIGGHSNTVDVEDDRGLVPVETGFIVYHARNYPNLVRMFDVLEVPTEWTRTEALVDRSPKAPGDQARN